MSVESYQAVVEAKSFAATLALAQRYLRTQTCHSQCQNAYPRRCCLEELLAREKMHQCSVVAIARTWMAEVCDLQETNKRKIQALDRHHFAVRTERVHSLVVRGVLAVASVMDPRKHSIDLKHLLAAETAVLVARVKEELHQATAAALSGLSELKVKTELPTLERPSSPFRQVSLAEA